MEEKENLREYVSLILEARARPDVETSSGTTVPFGSLPHVKDLESRITALKSWRDGSSKGSDRRANYARLINQLKSELKSAQRHAERHGSPPLTRSL